jgi:hypothetical protein
MDVELVGEGLPVLPYILINAVHRTDRYTPDVQTIPTESCDDIGHCAPLALRALTGRENSSLQGYLLDLDFDIRALHPNAIASDPRTGRRT